MIGTRVKAHRQPFGLSVCRITQIGASMKKALVIGAGPAGLTAAYELLTKSKDIEVTVFEESDCFGGISKTVNYKGNRMDMGGHRFF